MANHAHRPVEALTSRWLTLWSAVPIVVATRVQRMLLAGPSLSAADHREFTRMGSEKLDAFGESGLAMIAQWQTECLRLAMTPWWLSPKTLPQAGARVGRSMAKVAERGLAPIERRASANARRLTRAPKR